MRAREKFQQAANLMDAEQRMKKSMWGQFWSAHQRFFKYLCIASKVRRVVQLAREEVQNGKVRQLLELEHAVVRKCCRNCAVRFKEPKTPQKI